VDEAQAIQDDVQRLKQKQLEVYTGGRTFAMTVAIDLDIDTIDDIRRGHRQPRDAMVISNTLDEDGWSDSDTGPWFWHGFTTGFQLARDALQPIVPTTQREAEDDVTDPDEGPVE
jgi:hypothetical protein